MSKRETDILSRRTDHRSDLRLSCCIPVEAWMDGLTLEVYAPSELSESPQFV